MIGNNLNTGPNKENPGRWKSDDIIEIKILNINHLQNIPNLGAEPVRIPDNEKLLLLSSPQHPPSPGKRRAGCDGVFAEDGECINGVGYLGAESGVGLGGEASVLVGDEAEEGGFGGGERWRCGERKAEGFGFGFVERERVRCGGKMEWSCHERESERIWPLESCRWDLTTGLDMFFTRTPAQRES